MRAYHMVHLEKGQRQAITRVLVEHYQEACAADKHVGRGIKNKQQLLWRRALLI